MKKLLFILLCLPIIGFGQSVPQGINYQAVARDANGDILNQMYLNIGQGNALGLGNIGGFANNGYWSSTEVDSYFAWGQSFGYGDQASASKGNGNNVRAVRAF
jgi:hypothetical protein